MGWFKDDFFSTKMRRRVFGRKYRERDYRADPRSRIVRVAVLSSVVSSLVVLGLYVLLTGGKMRAPDARPALAGGQSYIETSERIITAAGKVRPIVVSIVNLSRQALEAGEQMRDYAHGTLPDGASLGSGVIFKKDGGRAYIVTNAHVLEDAGEVAAVLYDGQRREARVVGLDGVTDLAVVSIDSKGIDAVADPGHSELLRVGEMVIAVGNPLGFGDSLSQGIVSSTHRIIPVSLNNDGVKDWEQEVIQTDAAINQGNSGGALVDLNGKLVGINSMKIADMGVEGIGFAIPVDDALPIAYELVKRGKVARPYLGVYTMDLQYFLDDVADSENFGDEEEQDEEDEADRLVVPDGVSGVVVLEASGPAEEAGLQFNDIIAALDDEPIASTLELRKYIYNVRQIGDTVTVTYYRDGKKKTADVELAEKPAETVGSENKR